MAETNEKVLNGLFEELISQIEEKLARFAKEINKSMDVIETLTKTVNDQTKRINDNSKLIEGLTKVMKDKKITVEESILTDFDKRLKKVETKYLERGPDELEPDLPAIITVCEERLEELSKEKEWSKMPKEKIGTIIYETLDIVRDLIVQSAINKYSNMLLDKNVAKLTTISAEDLEKSKDMKKNRAIRNQQLYG